jgi:ribosomal protein L14E/L6E/L27E
MTVGQMVYSKSGRDKGMLFIIVAIEGEYAYLADGNVRRLEKPKKKKIKHIQHTNTIIDLTVVGPRVLQNADLRKWILPYTEGGLKHCQKTM